MKTIKMTNGKTLPLEMHRARIIQKCELISPEERQEAIQNAGNNTFLLNNRDVFLDMLTDSGVNAMSDKQLAAMMQGDDSYAGSETFFRLDEALKKLFGTTFFLPTHQGRASEHLISKMLVSPGKIVPMNYHFTTSKAHVTILGGEVLELHLEEALKIKSDFPFKGNMDIEALGKVLTVNGREKIAFVRMEAGTNLIGGQPFSLQNLREVSTLCKIHDVPLVMDASLLSDNLHFMKMREAACKDMTIEQISNAMADLCDIIYFSGRKLGSARGGGICTSSQIFFEKLRPMVPLYEGFLTYGGMSIKEMEAMAVGIHETLDEDIISQGPQFIEFMTEKLVERGTLSEQRNPDGTEPLANMELVRLALPRRVFTMSHILFAVDRIGWLFEHRDLIAGLEWTEEPEVLRFFYGRLKPENDWQVRLMDQFRKDFDGSR